ncbi:MAG TPA: hypothetical protein VE974_04315 [Thermoanaerobaculia bacterium]|nr:hypothetical protein [Thermoanaerobaculia bacterium]
MKPPLVVLALLLAACASAPVDMDEPRRIVGTENAVRVDAQVRGDQIRPGSKVQVTYEITNMRSTAIAIAELVPATSYDQETNTFTVDVGSEVPGNELLPRLIEIAPGETQTFRLVANIQPIMPPRSLATELPPAGFRLKVNFLGDTKPFRALIGIPERAVADSALADALFPLWLERNEIVYTNSVPMRWGPRRPEPVMRR